MENGKITTRGRLTIPGKVRKKYGIRAGTKIFFSAEKDGIKIFPMTPEMIQANIGFMKTDRTLLKALMDEKKREHEL